MRARLVLVILLVGLGLALLASSWSGRSRVLRAGDLLAIGQGDALIETAHRRMAGAGDSMQARFEEILEDERPAGLRFIGLVASDAQVLATAGDAAGPWPPTRPGPNHELERIGDRVRLSSGVGPPAPGSREPGHGGWPTTPPTDRQQAEGAEPRTERRRFRPPLLVIEFEPLVARNLEREATRTLVVGAVTSLALVAAALLLWRLLVHQERGERRLAEQRRFAALGEMSAVLAHEIRNPLASLKGHAQLLAERLEDGSAQRRGADRVVLEAKRLERLATSLLDFVRTGSVEPELIDPARLVRECAEDLDAARIDVDATTAPGEWRLDPLRIRQVLRNLLDNALQASPPDGRVQVRIAAESGDRLVFEVRDHGDGLPSGDVEQLFEPFRTTRATGTGLGLSVARRIVELHGGLITASNHPEGGAVFRVELPLMRG